MSFKAFKCMAKYEMLYRKIKKQKKLNNNKKQIYIKIKLGSKSPTHF